MNTHFSYVWMSRRKEAMLPWHRIHATEIPKFVEQYGSEWECFTSVQQYSSVSEKEGEDHICPLFFDFDSKDPEESRKDALKVVQFFSSLGIARPFIRIWFSGNKGF